MSSVKLVSITASEHSIDGKPLTPEELIVYIARVSAPNNQENLDTAPKLLRYLIKHKHWSPFEMVDMTVEIETSRAIAAQILRHRSFSFQEFSQRYASVNELPGYEVCIPRRQDFKNRQNSIDDLCQEDQDWFATEQERLFNDAMSVYNDAIFRGIAKECARFVLPLSTKTRIYMKGSIRSWIHYYLVRGEAATQKEHRDIAVDAINIMFENFPSVKEALEAANENIVLTPKEVEALRCLIHGKPNPLTPETTMELQKKLGV